MKDRDEIMVADTTGTMRYEPVNVYTDDSDEPYRHTLLVRHDGNRNFKKDWNSTLRSFKRSHPSEWSVVDVFNGLEALGWTVIELDCREVAY
jgi:hypothetical protein